MKDPRQKIETIAKHTNFLLKQLQDVLKNYKKMMQFNLP